MKKCKLFLLCLVVLSTVKNSAAQVSELERIEPMFWWVGMKNPKLQLVVHGNRIAEKTVTLNYPGVKLVRANKVENPNYLFLDLEISSTVKAGNFPIKFSDKNGKAISYNYVLKNRDRSANHIQGV